MTLQSLPRYLLDRRLGGPSDQSGSGGEEKKSCTCRESNLIWLTVQL